MTNLYILCEGQTEEQFVTQVLSPYLLQFDILAIAIILTTKQTQTKKFRGGVTDYRKIRGQMIDFARSHPNEHVTTMFDY